MYVDWYAVVIAVSSHVNWWLSIFPCPDRANIHNDVEGDRHSLSSWRHSATSKQSQGTVCIATSRHCCMYLIIEIWRWFQGFATDTLLWPLQSNHSICQWSAPSVSSMAWPGKSRVRIAGLNASVPEPAICICGLARLSWHLNPSLSLVFSSIRAHQALMWSVECVNLDCQLCHQMSRLLSTPVLSQHRLLEVDI